MEREAAEVEEAERKAASARQEEAAVLFGQLQQVRFLTSSSALLLSELSDTQSL